VLRHSCKEIRWTFAFYLPSLFVPRVLRVDLRAAEVHIASVERLQLARRSPAQKAVAHK
jgi:hypothetical protein